MIRWPLILVAALHFACSPSKGGQQASPDASSAPQAKPQTLALQTADDLPACAGENSGQLVYIISLQEFRVCSTDHWAMIDVKGKDGVDGAKGADGKDGKDGEDGANGLAVSAIWSFYDSSFVLGESVAEGTEPIFISEIRLVEFSDGTHFVSVNGQSLMSEDSNDVSHNDFAHSFFLAKDKTVESMKLFAYANSIAYYVIGTSNGKRTLTATIDIDDDINNNTLTTFTLIKND